ncbi:hypothetical protein M422DRAFT_261630 [Sphaerobolus stellatus SS14]|uniref:CHAT domain-containing protein n=1 Tax=Sphaerobolus stellatus (strain SS14) TaxID=990650 RepID=A0A0C9UMK7_SPHS4|nr:hypothetical protein M422DRAFT_261630 [Sphaerobolus stellatus SS14]
MVKDNEDIGGDADDLQPILANLWSWVVNLTILRIEGILAAECNAFVPHITWCATGLLAFLPLHTTGIYGSSDALNVSDFLILSSTKMLLITQPNTPKQRHLPGIMKEVNTIIKHVPAEHTLHLNHDKVTVSAVLQSMGKHNCIHLTCHGIQNIKDPVKSAFALYNGNLELQSLMTEKLNGAELAFLSACQTVTGDMKLPEEAVHLAV